jgi:hypothetical protein
MAYLIMRSTCMTHYQIFYVVFEAEREKLWRKFFWDPLQWWDHRVEKGIDH